MSEEDQAQMMLLQQQQFLLRQQQQVLEQQKAAAAAAAATAAHHPTMMDPAMAAQYQALLQQQQQAHQQQAALVAQQQQQQQAEQHQRFLEQQRAAMQAAAVATATTNPLGAIPTVLCCECGVSMLWNPSNMCVTCIRSRVDITEGIPKQAALHCCPTCGRYLQPPRNWIVAPLESKELLTLCMRRMRGLNRVKLVDASFVWTEPHSKRVKVKMTIQKEVLSSTILQQAFIIDFTIESLQCDACKRVGTDQSWRAMVQVRQKADHRRTFFLLEQLLIKHNAHSQCSNIKECPDGMDFYFQHRSHALKLLEFLTAVVPIRKKGESERLLSADKQSNTANIKISFSTEIAPICKDDLICLTPQQYKEYGGVGPLLVCTHVSNHIRFIDPISLRSVDLPAATYWKRPFYPLCTQRTKTEFTVLDADRIPEVQFGRMCLGEVEVARCSDFGVNDQTYRVRTHLGNLLHAGDTVQGYDLRYANLNDSSLDSYQGRLDLPEIVLVCKTYTDRKRRRNWKLKTIGATIEDDESVADGGGAAAGGEQAPQQPKKSSRNKGGRADALAEKRQQDYESFLTEIEHDPDLRSRINIYRDRAAEEEHRSGGAAMVDEGEEDPDDAGEIGVEELLDDLDIDPTADDDDDDEPEEGGDQ